MGFNMNGFTISLQEKSSTYLYEQIYEYIKDEIRAGRLLFEEKLPSTRSLADYLEVSRSTVDLAYSQLLSEGYIEARPYKGYFVCRIEELYHLPVQMETGRADEKEETAGYSYDFSPYGIDMNGFPFSVWRKISKNILNSDRKELFALGSPKGEPQLRETICKYLHSARGVNCEPSQLILGAGNDYLLMLLEKILDAKRTVAVENPTYQRAYKLFRTFGYEVKALSMDKYGMNPDKLRGSGADLAYVMPSHQFPTGIVMPIGRRTELLNWANEKEERYLIEDDYDSEFRYRGKPVPSLQSSDLKKKVIYLGTFSKSIAPAIRISYMVLPDSLLFKYRHNCAFLASTVSRVDQMILDEFIREGHYERHLNKMRKIYKGKHDILLKELKSLEPEFRISGENAGLHVLLHYLGGRTEAELIALAGEEGVKVYGLSDFLVEGKGSRGTLIMGYAAMTETEIAEGIRRLKKAWLP